jgi:hypothetical protein
VTTSFWHSFPAAGFWASARYPHVDYADLHAYISTSSAPAVEKEKMQADAAYYHTWHSQATAAARVGKPVVRGEAGLDVPGRQDEGALGVHHDRQGVWLHNFLWAGLDSGALYELYWWRQHIWNARYDHRLAYRPVNEFLSSLDLNKGGYRDWGGTVTHPDLRVVGQKNSGTGSMHLWIQNTQHTWKRVAAGLPIEPVSGQVKVPGFRAGASYEAEWWDTWAPTKRVLQVQELVADDVGGLTLPIESLARDVALRLRVKAGDQPAR